MNELGAIIEEKDPSRIEGQNGYWSLKLAWLSKYGFFTFLVSLCPGALVGP